MRSPSARSRWYSASTRQARPASSSRCFLLQQTVSSPDRKIALNLGGQGDLLHLGTMADVLSDHDEDQPLAFEFDFRGTMNEGEPRANGAPPAVSEIIEDAPIHFDVSYGTTSHGAPYVKSMEYRHAGLLYFLSCGERYSYTVATSREPTRARSKRAYAPERSVAFSAEAIAGLGPHGPAAQDLALAFTRELQAIAYLGPLREYPLRVYPWNGQMPGQLGVKGEFAVQALLASANLRTRKTDEDHWKSNLVAHVSRWLKAMDIADELEIDRQGKSNLYQVVVVRGKERANLVDVGFGVSQVLPVIALAYFVPPGSTVILEQPEIHLHPLAQAHLANLLVEVSRERRVQFLVETHSEHLFRRLQSLIADQATTPDQCALYFVGHGDEGATLRTLEVDDLGRVKNWPQRFFGDTAGEVERQTRRAFERLRATRGAQRHD